MFDFQVFIQLFLHMHWGTWLKFPKFINQHFLLPLVSNHPKGCSPLACRCWGYPILPNGAVWYSNGIICYPTLVAACWCQHQMATGYTNLLIPCRPPCLSINTSRCHHGICWLTPFNLCVCAMISSTMWNTRCIFHACYAFYACCCCCFVFCFSKLFVHSVSMFSVGGLKESSCLHDNCLSIYLSKYLSIYLNIYMIYIYIDIYHISLVAW
jgi:hypothetical protein